MDAFIGDFCRCDHSKQNLLMVSKNFYSRPYRINTMGVCFVTGGKSHYSGLCDFGAIVHYTTTVAHAHLRVNSCNFYSCTNMTFYQY